MFPHELHFYLYSIEFKNVISQLIAKKLNRSTREELSTGKTRCRLAMKARKVTNYCDVQANSKRVTTNVNDNMAWLRHFKFVV